MNPLEPMLRFVTDDTHEKCFGLSAEYTKPHHFEIKQKIMGGGNALLQTPLPAFHLSRRLESPPRAASISNCASPHRDVMSDAVQRYTGVDIRTIAV